MRRATWLLAAGVLLIAPPSAEAVEQVQDGGFEAATCAASDCSSSVWTEQVVQGDHPTKTIICSNTVACNGVSSARTGTKLAFFGDSGTQDLRLSQSGIQIPEAPATLSFYYAASAGITGFTFTASIDGTPVFTRDITPNTGYIQASVSVDEFAGPGTHVLQFRAAGLSDAGGFSLDDVSLQTPDPTPDETPPEATIERVKTNFENKTAKVEFTGTDDTSAPSALTFICQLDDRSPVACSSPHLFRRVRKGFHVVTVTALDEAGNESDPVSKAFKQKRRN